MRKLALAYALYLPLKAWSTWVFLTLWGWFVTPIYGVLPPPFWATAGLLVMAATLTARIPDKERDVLDGAAYGISIPLLFLVNGFLCKLLMDWFA